LTLAPTDHRTRSLHDALPICRKELAVLAAPRRHVCQAQRLADFHRSDRTPAARTCLELSFAIRSRVLAPGEGLLPTGPIPGSTHGPGLGLASCRGCLH